MKKNQQTMAVATVEKAMTPPPTKAEVLRATARALFLDHQEQIRRCEEKRNAVMSRIKKLSLKLARKILATAEVQCQEPYKPIDKFEVEISVSVPGDSKELLDLWAEYKVIAVPRRKPEDAFLNELRDASATQSDRVPQLLADPKVVQHLLESGKALLAAKAAQGAKPAIEA